MVHTSKPYCANTFMIEYSPCPGTVRSKLDREDTDEPCTRKSTGSGFCPAFGAPGRLRNMYSETSPFLAQYSLLQIFAGLALGESAPDSIPVVNPIPAPAS